MSQDDDAALARHAAFVRRAVERDEVWGLWDAAHDGWCTSDGEPAVVPFWGDRDYAARCATDEWAGLEPRAVPLRAFLIAWLTGLHAEGHLVGTNWGPELEGHEVAAAALQRELVDALPAERRAALDAELRRIGVSLPGLRQA
jgi:hypothetical protein